MNRFRIVTWACLALLVPGITIATDLGTAFTYQGQLKQGGAPVDAPADFQFTLWDAANGGSAVGSMVELLAQGVSAGVFNVQLDFGAMPFAGAARWLEIRARYPAGSGSYTLLTPRQPIEATPYAAYALDVKGRAWRQVGDTIWTLDEEGVVGVGLSSPLVKLHVRDNNGNALGTSNLTGEAVIVESEGKAALGLYSNLTGNEGSAVLLSEHDPNDPQPVNRWAMYRTGIHGTPPAQLRFAYGGDGSYANYSTLMALNTNGNVGIGTTAPAAKLDVNGTARVGGFRMPTGATDGYVLTADASGNGTWEPGGGNIGPWQLNGTSVYYNDGNVGIGTAAPPTKLTVVGDILSYGEVKGTSRIAMYSPAGALRGEMLSGDLTVGIVNTYGVNNATTCRLTYLDNYPDNGFIGVHRLNYNRAGMYVAGTGAGTIFADVKNFREASRKDETKDIWYACVEGPEAAAYVRGTATLTGGSATVILPDHFQEVTTLEGMTVQVTPRSAESKGLAVVSRALDRFVVHELFAGTGTYEFDWEVKAVRRTQQDYQVMRPWDDAMPGGTDKQAVWQARHRDIDERERRIESIESQRKGR